jgi:hypothetical protein
VKNARKRTRKRRADAQRLHRGNHTPDAALPAERAAIISRR